jgi:hypothetical protein
MNDYEWLLKLKVGDRVIVVGSGLARGDQVGNIHHFTKNFIVVTTPGNVDLKFRKESGSQAGDTGYYHHWLREATQERVETIQLVRTRSVTRLLLDDKVDWEKVPLETLKQLQEMVKPYLKI